MPDDKTAPFLFPLQLFGSRLVSASYDCTVVVSTLPDNLVQEITTSSSTSTNPLKTVTEEEVKQVSTVQVDLESFSCQIWLLIFLSDLTVYWPPGSVGVGRCFVPWGKRGKTGRPRWNHLWAHCLANSLFNHHFQVWTLSRLDENFFNWISTQKYFAIECLLRLSGHMDEVHSVDLRGGLLVSGAADTTVSKTIQSQMSFLIADDEVIAEKI